jgi:hypothetical protein
MTSIYVKLVCGSHIIDLNDFQTLYCLKEAVDDQGETVAIKVYVKADAGASQEVEALLHELGLFNVRAIAYAHEHVGEAVLLGMKLDDGNPYDTVFGRGWLWKELEGDSPSEVPAISYELHKSWADTADRAMIQDITITCRAKARRGPAGEKVFCWETATDRWIGMAMGGIHRGPLGGLMIELPRENLIPHSDFEYEADTDNGWTATGAMTVTENVDPLLVYNGFFSIILVCDGTARTFTVTYTAANTNTHCLSCYARSMDGHTLTSADCQLHYAGNDLTTVFTADPDRPGWYRLTASAAGVAAANVVGIKVKASKAVVVDSFQFEEGAFPTSLIYGNMGRGYSFSGADHTTSSLRAVPWLWYPNSSSGTCPPIIARTGGTFLAVVKAYRQSTEMPQADIMQCGGYLLLWTAPAGAFEFSDGAVSVTAACAAFAKDDILFVFARWGWHSDGSVNMSIRVYSEAGVLLESDTDTTFTSPTANAGMFIGSNAVPVLQWDSEVLEVQAWREVLTDAQCNARVRAGMGSAELPFIWSEDGAGTITNREGVIPEEPPA